MDGMKLAIFEGRKIRRHWDVKSEKWYFSVVDIIGVLVDQSDFTKSRKYWNKLSERLRKEGSEVVTNCHRLKLKAEDGKMRMTDTADLETLFRIIQSVPSPKVEPIKLWLARIGQERINEINDPELAMERMRQLYEKKGYPKDWIDKRVRGIGVRQSLTKEWQERGAQESIEFAILTNEIMQGAFEMDVEDYKNYKGLDKENLRDHMNDIELILTMLAEATTTKLHKDRNSKGFPRLKKDAGDGGKVAGRTRKDIEQTSGKKVVSKENYLESKKVKQLKK